MTKNNTEQLHQSICICPCNIDSALQYSSVQYSTGFCWLLILLLPPMTKELIWQCVGSSSSKFLVARSTLSVMFFTDLCKETVCTARRSANSVVWSSPPLWKSIQSCTASPKDLGFPPPESGSKSPPHTWSFLLPGCRSILPPSSRGQSCRPFARHWTSRSHHGGQRRQRSSPKKMSSKQRCWYPKHPQHCTWSIAHARAAGGSLWTEARLPFLLLGNLCLPQSSRNNDLEFQKHPRPWTKQSVSTRVCLSEKVGSLDSRSKFWGIQRKTSDLGPRNCELGLGPGPWKLLNLYSSPCVCVTSVILE